MWPFKKKPSAHPNLVFKSPQAFFEQQCKFGDTSIEVGKGVIAQVLDARELSASVAVKVNDDGSQGVMLMVASNDGGFIIPAQTPPGKGEKLAPGDLVMWVPHHWSEELGGLMPDKRWGWVGFVRAKINPEFSSNGFELLCRYD